MDVKKFLLNDLKFELVESNKENSRSFGYDFLPEGHFEYYTRDLWHIYVYESSPRIGLEVVLSTEDKTVTVFRGMVKTDQVPWVLSSCTNIMPEPGVEYYRDKIELEPFDDFIKGCSVNKFYLWRLNDMIRAPLKSGVHFIIPDAMCADDAQDIIEPTLRTDLPCTDEMTFDLEGSITRIEPSYLMTFDRLGINFINVTNLNKIIISTGNVIDSKHDLSTFGQLFVVRLGIKALKYDMVSLVDTYFEKVGTVKDYAIIKTIHGHARIAIFSELYGDFEVTGDLDSLIEYYSRKFGTFI